MDIGTGGYQAVRIPRGTTAQRPTAIDPDGIACGSAIRFNTNVTGSVDTPEFYDQQSNSWKQLATTTLVVDDDTKLDIDGSSAMTGGLTINSSAGLSIYGAAPQIKIGDSSTDGSTKKGFFTLVHDDVSEEPFGLVYGRSHVVGGTTINKLSLGGGDSAVNAASAIGIYCAADSTTTSGTEVARAKLTGIRILGSGNPDAGACLDLQGTAGGFLPPRVTTSQRDAIASGSPTEGMVVYNLTLSKLQCHNGSGWQNCF